MNLICRYINYFTDTVAGFKLLDTSFFTRKVTCAVSQECILNSAPRNLLYSVVHRRADDFCKPFNDRSEFISYADDLAQFLYIKLNALNKPKLRRIT